MTLKYKQRNCFAFYAVFNGLAHGPHSYQTHSIVSYRHFFLPLLQGYQRQVGKIENHVTHINLGRHERNDMRDSDFINYLYGKNEKERKGDGSPTKPSILYQRRVSVIYPTFL